MEEYRKLLDKLGMDMSLSGYHYWVEAINYAFTHDYYDIGRIYHKIADNHQLRWNLIERSMRYALDKNPKIKETITKQFDIDYRITNTVALAAMIRMLKKGIIK